MARMFEAVAGDPEPSRQLFSSDVLPSGAAVARKYRILSGVQNVRNRQIELRPAKENSSIKVTEKPPPPQMPPEPVALSRSRSQASSDFTG